MISRQSHTFLCNSRIIVHITVKIALSFASCNFLTVTGTIILELHSNVCDYLGFTNCEIILTSQLNMSLCGQADRQAGRKRMRLIMIDKFIYVHSFLKEG